MGLLNRRVAVASYAIVAVGLVALVYVSGYNYYYSYYYGQPLDILLAETVRAVAIAGLIVGPYFGLAGLIAKDRSIWIEANRLVHLHISIPFIAGLLLFYGSEIRTTLLTLIPAYIVFVSVASLMGIMASRAGQQTKQDQSS